MSEDNKPGFIITIGASAGGLRALNELVVQLDKNWNVAVFVVIHLSKTGIGNFLIHRLQKYTTYTCVLPVNGQKIEAGKIYLAHPDMHLLMRGDRIVLGEGPAENRWRPSIDVLFRSAAVHFGNRVIGIILTGYLNDGMSGMWAIKRSGGYTIVQDPNEAEYPDMPLAVLEKMEVDHCVLLGQMGETIAGVINNDQFRKSSIPEELKREATIAEEALVSIETVASLGEKQNYACPDCGGGLWNVDNELGNVYRCHIGHAYQEADLLTRQGENLESTLWVAVRMMEERKNLLHSIAERDAKNGFLALSQEQRKKAIDLDKHIINLKEVLFSSKRM
jgi:two-component system chemotaxis response regulator CheB